MLALNWWDVAMDRSRLTRAVKAVTMPAWIVTSAFLNATGLLLDRLDHTGAFYSNVLLVAKKLPS